VPTSSKSETVRWSRCGACRVGKGCTPPSALVPHFFCETSIQENSCFALDARAAQHVRVLRMRTGEAIELFDGFGGEVSATISEIGKRDVIVETQTRVAIERELARRITLNVGLIANDRFDWFIQKATELGVASIQPIYSERAQRIPGDPEKRVAHWQGVIIAACEQCGRNRLPTIAAPITFDQALSRETSGVKVLMDAEGDASVALEDASAVDVFVGPEGGFTANELAHLRERCTRRLRIGMTVLRAETAAIAALARLGA
jgi:16S rRNA (uracil1498-N3)-methyltransferase